MKVRFGCPKVWLIEKYVGRSDLCDHLSKWTDAYGAEPQLEWVKLLCHTLDVIPMNWYLVTQLHYGTMNGIFLDKYS